MALGPEDGEGVPNSASGRPKAEGRGSRKAEPLLPLENRCFELAKEENRELAVIQAAVAAS